MRMVSIDERRRRLSRRHFLAHPASNMEQVARGMTGLHSSDPVTVYLSARARIDGIQVADIEHALYEERSVVRVLGPRRTLFVVPPDLAGAMDAACTQGYAPAQRQRLVRLLAGQPEPRDESWLDALMDRTLTALQARGEATARELVADVPELGLQIQYGQGTFGMSTRVLFLLATEGRIIRGRPLGSYRSGQYRWVPVDGWITGGWPRWESGDARRVLAEAWLKSYGPGTLTDLKWWTGWTVGTTKEVLAHLDVEKVSLENGTGFLLSGDKAEEPEVGEWIALLPGLDSTLMGWKERDWYLGGHQNELFDNNGNAGPTVWWNGRVIGGWGQQADGAVVVELLEYVPAEVRDRVDAERQRLTSWFDGVVVRSRFPSPMERRLRG
jgi:hypothetical protein